MQLVSALILIIVAGLGALWLLGEQKQEGPARLNSFDFDAAKSREDVKGVSAP